MGLIGQGRSEDAAALLKKAVELSIQANGVEHKRTLATQIVYGEALVELGRHSEAIALLKDAAVAATRPADTDDRRARFDAMQAHLGLTNALNSARSDATTESARTTLRLAAELNAARGLPQASQARSLLGQSLVRQGKVASGILELERAYVDSRALLGSDHPQTEMMANFLGWGRLEVGDSRGAVDVFQAFFDSEAAKSATAIVVEEDGRVWLSEFGPRNTPPRGGEAIAVVGPLQLLAAKSYAAVLSYAVMRPGDNSRVHTHPGPEGWYVLAGEQCLETPAGANRARAGATMTVPPNVPMELNVTGTTLRRAFALVIHDSAQQRGIPSDWKPSGASGQ